MYINNNETPASQNLVASDNNHGEPLFFNIPLIDRNYHNLIL